jgi:hypothetical protein
MHSNMVLTAPASFCRRSSASSGVDSRRSRVPTPGEGNRSQHVVEALGRWSGLLGQLNPSKSMGGLRVYGLAGRLEDTGGVGGVASSLGSLAASLSDTWETPFVIGRSFSFSAHGLEDLLLFASTRSTVALLP